MSARAAARVVTGNDLISGDAVWLAPGGRWVDRHAEAELLTDDERAVEALKAAERQSGKVVGVYLADARPGPNGPEPMHYREAMRARGPSNYNHGKQAEA